MEERELRDLETIFAQVEDPRLERTKQHRLRDIIIIAICAVICGADGWVGIEEFGKAKEITAIPLLLQQLALKGCIVTIDAMGTQTKIAAQIIEQEGDYALALKDNQGNLYEEVKATFRLAEKEAFATVKSESDRRVEKGHGRLEIREYYTISDAAILE